VFYEVHHIIIPLSIFVDMKCDVVFPAYLILLHCSYLSAQVFKMYTQFQYTSFALGK